MHNVDIETYDSTRLICQSFQHLTPRSITDSGRRPHLDTYAMSLSKVD